LGYCFSKRNSYFGFLELNANPKVKQGGKMPTVLASITDAPTGTEYRTSPVGQWQSAKAGQNLYSNYQARNTQSSTYGISVQSEAEVEFPDGATSVTAGSYQGSADYKNPQGTWNELPQNQGVTAIALRTGTSTTVPVSILGVRSAFKPRGW
jgi:hypothetical protein